MKALRGYLAALVLVLLLVAMLAIVTRPLMPWFVAIFLLVVIYGVLVRD